MRRWEDQTRADLKRTGVQHVREMVAQREVERDSEEG